MRPCLQPMIEDTGTWRCEHLQLRWLLGDQAALSGEVTSRRSGGALGSLRGTTAPPLLVFIRRYELALENLRINFTLF